MKLQLSLNLLGVSGSTIITGGLALRDLIDEVEGLNLTPPIAVHFVDGSAPLKIRGDWGDLVALLPFLSADGRVLEVDGISYIGPDGAPEEDGFDTLQGIRLELFAVADAPTEPVD